MDIVFRVDASLDIGTGHVIRCLTLADALRHRGANCQFVCRPHTGHLLDVIARRGYRAVALPALTTDMPLPKAGPAHAHWLGNDWGADAADTRYALGVRPVDWLVVDHYALDARWEQALRPACKRLMVIDDLADRAHDCDLLLDQNLGRISEDYGRLVSSNTIVLVGPRYALLRPEFAQLRTVSLARRASPQLKRLLIAMGGVDKDNVTACVLRALNACALPSGLHITVVMGPHAPWRQQVQAQAGQMRCPTQVLVGVSDMARLMTDSDLAIGAAGGTAWERCCLGLPSIVMVLAVNQEAAAEALRKSDAAVAVKSISEIQNWFQIELESDHLCRLLQDLSKAAEKVTDGLGTTSVTNHLMANRV